MKKETKEWIVQSEFDLDTAESLFHSKKYVYSVYMCHLSLEKSIKALYCETFDTIPPRTHDLLFLLEETKIALPEELDKFVTKMNHANIETRYPSELLKAIQFFSAPITKDILKKTKEVRLWIQHQFDTLSNK